MLEALIEVWTVRNGQWCWQVTLPAFTHVRLTGDETSSRREAIERSAEVLGRYTEPLCSQLGPEHNQTAIRLAG